MEKKNSLEIYDRNEWSYCVFLNANKILWTQTTCVCGSLSFRFLCAFSGRKKTEWLVFFLLNSGAALWHPLNLGENYLLSHLWHLIYTLLKSRCRAQSIFYFSQRHHSHKALMYIVECIGKKKIGGHTGCVCSCFTSILKTKNSLLVWLLLNVFLWNFCELLTFSLSSLHDSVFLLQIPTYFLSRTISHSLISYFSLSSAHTKVLFLA